MDWQLLELFIPVKTYYSLLLRCRIKHINLFFNYRLNTNYKIYLKFLVPKTPKHTKFFIIS